MVDRNSIYKRPLLKLSGEAFGNSETGTNHDYEALSHMAIEIADQHRAGTTFGIVCGGGNLARGAELALHGMKQPQSDYVGMLGTLMNALVLQDILAQMIGVEDDTNVRVQSALSVVAVCEMFNQGRLDKHLSKNRIVIFGAGSGDPWSTTDSTSALRALQMRADVLLMAKNGVDGVYTADPKKDPTASFIPRMSYKELFEMGRGVMDLAAVEQCREHKVPIVVFNMMKPGNLAKVLKGETVGTLITS